MEGESERKKWQILFLPPAEVRLSISSSLDEGEKEIK